MKLDSYLSYLTVFRRHPIPSISHYIMPPDFKNLGGSKPIPTPAGVSIAIIF
jgi:hypothetical protein